MDVMVRGGPTPGSTHPGDLYVDLQSRTLWLGVDHAVDPTESVLISDMVQLLEEIADSEARSKSYTDTQVNTRAPTTHTHTANQIVDFVSAVTAVASAIPGLAYIKGMIMMYTGSLADIGVGGLAGWALCDGNNGTPNLKDKFVLGAGNKIIGSVTPQASFLSAVAGSHVHNITPTALTIAMIPSHNHGGITGYISHNHQHYLSANTGTESHDHSHAIAENSDWRCDGNHSWGLRPVGSAGYVYSSGRNQAHYHGLSAWTGGVSENHYHSIPAQGSGAAHDHAESYAGDHQHTITSANLRDTLPYYALAFIMKL